MTSKRPLVFTMDSPPVLLTGNYTFGSAIFVTHTQASNVVKDVQENIRNLVGGRLKHYDALVTESVSAAFEKLKDHLEKNGWDGACAVRISHPSVVDGGCEVVVYGTPFRLEEKT
ncbi:heavy metal-binding domain-containing protein [Aestuariivita sp.]|uniref:YbjQ family protein n=1 Tax=Aestuariivita sp. TaxID=1872407 RepID=UPI00216EB9EF|nr:heavy metal-binding domain-containing protein [Aestuariivita sp.]MCE8005982.1 heavy metal-binding domain-containing protein [Aestuariivita sp.]